MLHTKGVTFSYHPTSPKLQFPDLHCGASEHLLLLGQSGCGKTTLLHLLAGLLRPQTGTIHVAQTDITRLSETSLDRFRGKHIGIVFQRTHLLTALNVSQNLLAAQYLAGQKPNRSRVAALLQALGLSHKYRSPVQQLSVGEQQRVSIARALVNQPALLLADEPTSSLDDHHCAEVAQLLSAQAAQHGAALIIVTHDQRLKNHFSRHVLLSAPPNPT